MSSPTAISYKMVDPQMMVWAQRHELQIQKVNRGDPVRSVWVTGPCGKAQIWLGWPVTVDRIEVLAAKLDLAVREKWTSRASRVVPLRDLTIALEELFQLASEWIANTLTISGVVNRDSRHRVMSELAGLPPSIDQGPPLASSP